MDRRRRQHALALAALALLAGYAPAALSPPLALAGWSLPAPGQLRVPFRFDSRDRFRAGQHRDVSFRVGSGTLVRAACAGRVTFAGTVPRAGMVVAQACGPLSATYVGLGALSVRRGRRLAPGTPLGRAGSSGLLGLGARRRGEPDGYVDPMRLLGGPVAPRVPVAPRGPLARVPAEPPAPHPQPAPAALPVPDAHAAPSRLPAGAWWLPLGLGLLGASALVGLLRGLSRRISRARRAPGRLSQRSRAGPGAASRGHPSASRSAGR